MQKLNPKMSEAFVTFPYSAETMIHVAGKLKNVFLECGAGFPILLLHGLPANGKTSTMKACLTGEDISIKFAEGLKTVKEKMEECGECTVLLDNYPRFLSHYKREKSLRILDYVIDMASEDRNMPSVVITAEPNILEDLQQAESLRERMLIIPVPEIGKDERLYSIRDYLTQNRDEYLQVMKTFDKWIQENPIDKEDIRERLVAFREAYSQYTVRFTGLVFTYYYACMSFSKFLEEVYGTGVVRSSIDKNVRQLFDWKNDEKSIKTSIVSEVWEMLIMNENAFEIVEPRLGVCKYLLQETCSMGEYNCWRCDDGWLEELYNPMELEVDHLQENCVILIKNPSLIPGFPKHIKCKNPLLIVENTALFKMMNLCLEEYSRRNGVSVMSFSPKKLNKEFFINNLCLFEYVGCNHNSYTFSMMDTAGTSKRVMFMKLKKEQYDLLKDRAVKRSGSLCYEERDVKNMNNCLKTICSSVQSLFGDVGVPSRIIE